MKLWKISDDGFSVGLPSIPCLMLFLASVFLSGFGCFVHCLSWWTRLLIFPVLYCFKCWLKLLDFRTLKLHLVVVLVNIFLSLFEWSLSEFGCESFGLWSEGKFCADLKFHSRSWFIALSCLVCWETSWETKLCEPPHNKCSIVMR